MYAAINFPAKNTTAPTPTRKKEQQPVKTAYAGHRSGPAKVRYTGQRAKPLCRSGAIIGERWVKNPAYRLRLAVAGQITRAFEKAPNATEPGAESALSVTVQDGMIRTILFLGGQSRSGWTDSSSWGAVISWGAS